MVVPKPQPSLKETVVAEENETTEMIGDTEIDNKEDGIDDPDTESQIDSHINTESHDTVSVVENQTTETEPSPGTETSTMEST